MSTLRKGLASPRSTVVLLLVLALLLRLPNLGQTVWFDEACMARQRLGTFGQMVTTLYVDNHPPLYVIFMYYWVALFGDGEISMRIPSLLVGLASIPLTMAVGTRLLSRRVGLGAALLMCLSPVHIWYSIEARLYAPILFLALLGVWLFHKLLDGGKRAEWIAFVALLAIMPLVHYYLAVYLAVFFALGIFAEKIGSTRHVAKRMLLWNGLMMAGILAFVAVKFSMAEFNTSLGYMGDFNVPESFRLLFQWGWTGNASAGGPSTDGSPTIATGSPGWLLWACLQVLAVALFLRGLLAIARQRRERPEALCVLAYLFCLPAFLLALPLVGLGGTYISRSILPFLPFFFMVLAAGWDSLATARLRKLAGTCTVSLLLINLAFFYAREDEWTVYKPHQDWRRAAAYFTAELAEGAEGRPIFTTMPNQRSLSYYEPRIQTATNLQSTMYKVEQARSSFTKRLGETLGTKVANYATAIAEDVETTRLQLLSETQLLVLPLRKDTLDTLESALESDDNTFYVLHNLWNPPEDLRPFTFANAASLELLEQTDLRGLTLYKLRLRDE